ncbi:MAG: GFA family protein [Candidatus Paceibacterota bacterium]
MENETTYTGSCHCGAVAFEFTTAPIEAGLACNCSHCHRKGFILTFLPKSQFTLKSGEDNLTEYRFNKKQLAHQFCKTCGVQAFAFGTGEDGTETAAINLRCVEGIDIDSLTLNRYNGKDV